MGPGVVRRRILLVEDGVYRDSRVRDGLAFVRPGLDGVAGCLEGLVEGTFVGQSVDQVDFPVLVLGIDGGLPGIRGFGQGVLQ